MAEIFRYGFYIVPRPNSCHGISVPQIVEPKAWHFNRLNHVLKLLMDILLAIMAANSIGKNKPLFIFP